MTEKDLDIDDMVKTIHFRLQELGLNISEQLLDLIFDLEYEYLHENGLIEEGDIY